MRYDKMKVGGESLILIFMFLFLAGLVSAIPQTFNIHGKVTDSDGTALSGATVMNFSIYDVYTGGSALWTSGNQTVSVDSDGVYSLILTAIDLNFSEQYFLGVSVEGDAEMTPRINLTSSPYTFRANVSDYLEVTRSYEIANLTLGQKITFAFGEIIDNIVNGWVRITGGLNVTGDAIIGGELNVTGNVTAQYFIGDGSHLTNVNGSGVYVPYTGASSNLDLGAHNFLINNSVFFVNATSGRVGIGTASPTDSVLHLFKRTASDGLLKIQNSPSSGSCPANMSYINKNGGYCIDNYEAVALNSDGSWHEESDNQEWRNTGTNSTATLLAAGGYAGSISGKYPWVYIKQTEARTACANAGKHLCTSDEWMGAADVGGSIYNLDATITACNVVSGSPAECTDSGPNAGDACVGGHMTGCVSSEGVYDMTGNVWEWTNETVDTFTPDVNDWHCFDDSGWTTTGWGNCNSPKYGNDMVWIGNSTSERAVRRGGSWYYGANAGPFCAYLYSGPATPSYAVGFRCCSS